MEGRRDRGKPCRRRLDRVRKAYDVRTLEIRDAPVMCIDREMSKDFMDSPNGGESV